MGTIGSKIRFNSPKSEAKLVECDQIMVTTLDRIAKKLMLKHLLLTVDWTDPDTNPDLIVLKELLVEELAN